MTSSIKQNLENLLQEKQNPKDFLEETTPPRSPTPPKKKSSVGHKISGFFQKVFKSSSAVKNISGSPKTKRKQSKSKTINTPDPEFNDLEVSQTLTHFERPKPPRDRRKPTRMSKLNKSAKISPIAETIDEVDESGSGIKELSNSLTASSLQKLQKCPSDKKSIGSLDLGVTDIIDPVEFNGSPKGIESNLDPVTLRKSSSNNSRPDSNISNGSRRIITEDHSVQMRKSSESSGSKKGPSGSNRSSNGSNHMGSKIGSNRASYGSNVMDNDHCVQMRKSSESSGSKKGSYGSQRGSVDPFNGSNLRSSNGSNNLGSKIGSNRESYGSNRLSYGSNQNGSYKGSAGSHRGSVGSNRESIGSKHSADRFTQRMISHEESKNDGIENPTSL